MDIIHQSRGVDIWNIMIFPINLWNYENRNFVSGGSFLFRNIIAENFVHKYLTQKPRRIYLRSALYSHMLYAWSSVNAMSKESLYSKISIKFDHVSIAHNAQVLIDDQRKCDVNDFLQILRQNTIIVFTL